MRKTPIGLTALSCALDTMAGNKRIGFLDELLHQTYVRDSYTERDRVARDITDALHQFAGLSPSIGTLSRTRRAAPPCSRCARR